MVTPHTLLIGILAVGIVGCVDDDASWVPPQQHDEGSEDYGDGHDDEDIVVADPPPPPIQGGTLLVVSDRRAVVADPDRDAIFVVALDDERVVASIALQRGDQPGRMVEDDTGIVHVALRGGGAIVAVDVERGTLVSRRSICTTPNGLTYHWGKLHVACQSGAIYAWSPRREAPERVLALEGDLRDIVGFESLLYVSRFRSAEVIRIDEAGEVFDVSRAGEQVADDGAVESRVLWRLRATPGVGVYALHQLHRSGGGVINSSGAGYRGGCAGDVRVALTKVDGVWHGTRRTIPGAFVPDFDVLPSGKAIAVAATGNAFDAYAGRPDVLTFAVMEDDAPSLCDEPDYSYAWSVTHEMTSVAYLPGGALLLQSREPARLIRLEAGRSRFIELSDVSRKDTGLALFHADTGAGVACVSCHPAGRDDGHVWRFANTGKRRTQSLAGTLAGTAPYHWDGTMQDLNVLMAEVFTDRMSGGELSFGYRNAFSSFLLSLPAPPAAPLTDAAERGRLLFETVGGCSGCHGGPSYTNNTTVEVGTGGAFQVPSLIGIGARAPYMHDGCAKNLAERFDAKCGGDAHGETLTVEQQSQVIAYLQTL